MTRAEAAALLEEFKRRIDSAGAGAMLMIFTGITGSVDAEFASNLSPDNQEKVCRMILARVRGAQ